MLATVVYLDTMTVTPQKFARLLLVVGFALLAAFSVSVVITLLRQNDAFGGLPKSLLVQESLLAVASLVGLVAWWFLSSLEPATPHQQSVFVKGFGALALQYVVQVVVQTWILFQNFPHDLSAYQPWLSEAGELFIVAGFMLLTRVFYLQARPDLSNIAFDDSLSEDGPNLTFDEVKEQLGWR